MKSKGRVILHLKGGLGNQLFMYAAARRLALHNGAALVLDHLSGFAGDFFRRHYALHHFTIPQNLATPGDRFVCCSEVRRRVVRRLCRLLPFQMRPYLLETCKDFDPRLLDLRLSGDVYLEGYWQSEGYFKDVAPQIRADLQIRSRHDPGNVLLARRIEAVEAVSVHTRFLHGVPGGSTAKPSPVVATLSPQYYASAFRIACERLRNPHFFVFSDYPTPIGQYFKIDAPATAVTQNDGDARSYEDLWLMSLCRHHIVANSTFSWWGAWLNPNPEKLVIAPGSCIHFGHKGLLPEDWIVLVGPATTQEPSTKTPLVSAASVAARRVLRGGHQ